MGSFPILHSSISAYAHKLTHKITPAEKLKDMHMFTISTSLAMTTHVGAFTKAVFFLLRWTLLCVSSVIDCFAPMPSPPTPIHTDQSSKDVQSEYSGRGKRHKTRNSPQTVSSIAEAGTGFYKWIDQHRVTFPLLFTCKCFSFRHGMYGPSQTLHMWSVLTCSRPFLNNWH